MNCEWQQRINSLSMFRGLPLLFSSCLVVAFLQLAGRFLPLTNSPAVATGDAVWVLQAAALFVKRKIIEQFLQGTESNMWLSNLHVYPIRKKQKTKYFDLYLISCSVQRYRGSLFGLLGRRSYTSFKRQKSELWLVSPVSRCQEIPPWIPLSHSRNYTMISPRMTGQVKLSKAFRRQLDHLWCMFLPPCLFKVTLAAYYTTAHSL